MIPLIKNTFINEEMTKKALVNFIENTSILSMNTKCKEFELAFSKYQGCKESVLFNSGGSANLAILQSLKNTKKLVNFDKIGFSALTWSTNVMPIIQMGFEPVPIDCDPKTLNVMSYNLKERLKTKKIKAFFITNALGFTGDLEVIKDICLENNILLFEDNCESLGTELLNGKAGNYGIASSFSFYVAHHMSTIEGGMVCSNDDELLEMLKIVRANGWDRNLNYHQQTKFRNKYNIISEFEAKYTFYDLAYNLRPTEITGFLGLYQLQFLNEIIKKREDNFKKLEAILNKNDDFIKYKHSHIMRISNFAFPVLCKTLDLKNKYISRFVDSRVEIRPIIAGNIQKQPFYKKYIEEDYNLPGADFIHDCGFYFGNYPELTNNDLEILSNCLKV